MDLHLHTPASSDYQEPKATYLDVLQTAEARELDIIAFTDHNTVAGLRHLRDEIAELELLERLKRLLPEESHRLNEYRRLLDKILLLPGFEFTATFGFHIMGVFPPETTVRELEHLLLSMNVPRDQLDRGAVAVGATTDVLTAYRLIAEAGGLAIAAHANSTNGVAMRGFGFGGQTKIAFTQDMNLCALEVTDLDQKGRRSTSAFFSGTKPEYSRRMHCITGSDAHRLARDPHNPKNLGIGDRATDLLLDEVSFEALKALFQGSDFARVRPHVAGATSQPEFDHVQQAREAGANLVQAFHDSMQQRGGKLYTVIADVCAFANTNGGTIYIGVGADPKQAPAGVPDHEQAIRELRSSIARILTPPIDCTVDVQDTKGKKIIRVLVPRGDDAPYALDDNKIYVREEAETSLAVRDEIVQLVLRGKAVARAGPSAAPQTAPAAEAVAVAPAAPGSRATADVPAVAAPAVASVVSQPLALAGPPKTGVEIVASEERDGTHYHTMRDLRNGSVVKNVTRTSARKLWHYAITAKEAGALNPSAVTWQGSLGLWRKTHKGGQTRYDLVQRADDELRVYFGVTEDGIHGPWRKLVEGDDRPQAPAAPWLPAALQPAGLPVMPSTADTVAATPVTPEPEVIEPPVEVEALLQAAADEFELPVTDEPEVAGAPTEDASAPLLGLEAAAPALAEAAGNGAGGRPARKSRGSRGSGSSKKAAKSRATAGTTTAGATKAARKQSSGAAKAPSRPRSRRPKAEEQNGE